MRERDYAHMYLNHQIGLIPKQTNETSVQPDYTVTKLSIIALTLKCVRQQSVRAGTGFATVDLIFSSSTQNECREARSVQIMTYRRRSGSISRAGSSYARVPSDSWPLQVLNAPQSTC